MRLYLLPLIPVLLSGCNPYERHANSHYYVQAAIDPDRAEISANVQMVMVAGRVYRDSICLCLNPEFSIQALSAQELRYYEFRESPRCELVLYIEELVNPGEQIHISMSYSGKIHVSSLYTEETGDAVPLPRTLTRLEPGMNWLPWNEDTRSCTYRAKIAVPGGWMLDSPETATGDHGKFLLENRTPESIPILKFSQEGK